MSNTTKPILVCLTLMLVAAGSHLTAYYAPRNMQKGAENKNFDAIDYIDYLSLWERLKANFTAWIAREAGKMQHENPFALLGVALAAVLINQMIDTIVTPEGLAMVIKGEKPNFNLSETVFNKESLPEKSNTEIPKSYKGFNRFVVKVK